MAATGHILLGNHVVNHTKGLAPASAFSCDPNLRSRGLGPVIRGGHTPGTTLGGYIPKFAYVGGLIPSPITSKG